MQYKLDHPILTTPNSYPAKISIILLEYPESLNDSGDLVPKRWAIRILSKSAKTGYDFPELKNSFEKYLRSIVGEDFYLVLVNEISFDEKPEELYKSLDSTTNPDEDIMFVNGRKVNCRHYYFFIKSSNELIELANKIYQSLTGGKIKNIRDLYENRFIKTYKTFIK
jgi:hypothetical protein